MATVTFNRKTGIIYDNQKKRARKAGVVLTYDLADIRSLIHKAFEWGACAYCACVLTVKNVSMDHDEPVSRGGPWELDNLVVCCIRCNQIKGNMTGHEFLTLLRWAQDNLGPSARESLLSRLRAGGAICRR